MIRSFAAFVFAVQVSFLPSATNAADWDDVSGYRRFDTCIAAITGLNLAGVQHGVSPAQCALRCDATPGCAAFQYGLTIYKTPSRGGRWCAMKSAETFRSFKTSGWLCPPTQNNAYGYYVRENSLVL